MAKHQSAVREPSPAKIQTSRAPSRYNLLPLLPLLAGSGCAALIYEIVWFQLLQLVIGSSAVSLGLLLAFYMGGLCLGSVLFGRLAPFYGKGRLHARRIYGFLELGIAAFGIIALYGVPLIGRLYLAGPTNGLAGLVFRGVVAGLCLAPPTLLMGCTFPAAARWIEMRRDGVSWLGLLYSANTSGAVAGCVLAGFYLLRVHNLAVATYAAAAMNVAVALTAFLLPSAAGAWDAETLPAAPPQRARGTLWIYASIGLSGLTALGAEVVWTRLLSLLLGATVYTFSIILAVFLVGLWAGSTGGSLAIRQFSDPRLALAGCQVLIGLACAWTAYTLAYGLPYWPVDPWLSINPWMNFEIDVLRCAWAILPAALLWGASFPLALACAAGEDEDPARLTGEVYAANTAGAIAGALLFSLVLIPSMGTAGSQQILVWVAALSAAAALAPLGLMRLAWGCAVAVVLAWIASSTISEVPWQMIAYGRRVAPALRAAHLGTEANAQVPLFVGEGINSSVVIAQRGDERLKDRVFYVSGKAEASSEPVDMRLQRMMGHLPALIHPDPGSVLVVGFGAGVTAGSFVPYPEVQRIVICELEPLIPAASGNFFAQQNNNVLLDSRTSVVYDDARHSILTNPDKFDIITTDPIHPWVKGTSTLYSREFYELEKRRLNPGGVVAQWLPLYESDEDTVRTELATFFSVFPGGTVWSNYKDGDGYDLVLLGRAEESAIDVDAMDRRLKTAAYARVSASLAEVGLPSAVDLLATYVGRAPDLQPMLAGAQINDDLSMRLQYLAGLGLNSAESARLYHEILSYRKFPEALLTGSGERIAALRESLQRAALTF
ncbi:MAG TPA: fused MFS/spermidine synthase [Bryobacteraceae bacterium]